MAFLSHIRLGLLIGLLASLWSYAIYTAHPAPAWGMSRLPDLILSTIVFAVVGFGVTLIARLLVGKHRGDKT